MNFNREEFIEVSWFGLSYKSEMVEYGIKDLIIKTYNLKTKNNSLYIDSQSNDSYIICKLENGLEGFDDEEKRETFNDLNNNVDTFYLYHLDYILEDMIEKGVLERGNYLISYSW